MSVPVIEKPTTDFSKSNKNRASCYACGHPEATFWVRFPDIYGDFYLYPLPESEVCPVCQRSLEECKK